MAALNPGSRPTSSLLQAAYKCLDCGQTGATHLPRYGDGMFCMIDCRDSYHLKNYNKIFHGDIPKLNIQTSRGHRTSSQQLIVRQNRMLQNQSLNRVSQRHLCQQMSLASRGLYMGMHIAQTRSTVTQIWIHNAMRPPTSPKQTTAK